MTGAAKPPKPRETYVVVQEGGTSNELYLHAHATRADARRDRIDCRDSGNYRTSPIVEIPPQCAALGEVFYSTVEAILHATTALNFPD